MKGIVKLYICDGIMFESLFHQATIQILFYSSWKPELAMQARWIGQPPSMANNDNYFHSMLFVRTNAG